MSGCDYMNPRFRVTMEGGDGKTKCERCKNYKKQEICDKCTHWKFFKESMEIELKG